MSRRCESSLAAARALVARDAAVLDALNPTAALARGYTLTLSPDGKILRSVAGIAGGDTLVTKFSDGAVRSKVVENGAPD